MPCLVCGGERATACQRAYPTSWGTDTDSGRSRLADSAPIRPPNSVADGPAQCSAKDCGEAATVKSRRQRPAINVQQQQQQQQQHQHQHQHQHHQPRHSSAGGWHPTLLFVRPTVGCAPLLPPSILAWFSPMAAGSSAAAPAEAAPARCSSSNPAVVEPPPCCACSSFFLLLMSWTIRVNTARQPEAACQCTLRGRTQKLHSTCLCELKTTHPDDELVANACTKAYHIHTNQ